jgi:hypothetical protein
MAPSTRTRPAREEPAHTCAAATIPIIARPSQPATRPVSRPLPPAALYASSSTRLSVRPSAGGLSSPQ